MRKRMLLAASIGIIAWSGPVALIPLSLALPLLCGRSDGSVRARDRGLIAFTYYSAAMWPLTAAGIHLYGLSAVPFLVTVTAIVSGLLAASWTLRSTVLPLILTAIPPIGIFGVANPLTAAGLLFPGTSWAGVIATVLLPAALIRRPKATSIALVVASLALNLSFTSPRAPVGWQGVDTNFGDIRAKADRAAEFRAALSIQETILNSNARVLVFPELAVTRWTEATEAFWEPTLSTLAAHQRSVLLGAGLPIKGTQDYQNVLIQVPFRGADETLYVSQNIPLPWAMWNPIAIKDRVPLRLWGHRTLQVAGERAAVLICYEQLLAWPVFTAVSERPNVMVAIANAVWTVGTPIPSVQAASIHAWSRLFNIPVISSVNR